MKVKVEVDCSDVMAKFGELSGKEQDKLLRGCIGKGARVIADEAQLRIWKSFDKKTPKVHDMVASIGAKWHPNRQAYTVFTTTTGDYYSYMANWFIAGTRERYIKRYVQRQRRSGKLTKRRYKVDSKSSYGRIKGNDAILEAYNIRRIEANAAIEKEFERLINKLWRKKT